MNMLQLNPALPVISVNGRALAHIIIDYGQESEAMWVCFHEDGSIKTYPERELWCEATEPVLVRKKCRQSIG